jgi:hypothetical protein
MKDFKEMTPIELNVLLNKVNENHLMIKANIKKLTHEVDEKEIEINQNLEKLKTIEDKYVEIMAVLMEKQGNNVQ